MAADGRPRDVVTDGQDHRLEQVHEPAAAERVPAACRASGMTTAATRTAATTSISMNRVICARTGSASRSRPRTDLPVGELQGGMIHHMAHGAVAVSFRHGVFVPVGSTRQFLASTRPRASRRRAQLSVAQAFVPSRATRRMCIIPTANPRTAPTTVAQSSPTSDPAPPPPTGATRTPARRWRSAMPTPCPTDKPDRRSGGGTYHSLVPRPSRGGQNLMPPRSGNGELPVDWGLHEGTTS